MDDLAHDDDAGDEPLLPVETFDTEPDAKAAGAELVSRGIGAAVERILPDEIDDKDPQAMFQVLVLKHEMRRAQEILGIVEPEERPPANPEEPMKLKKAAVNWKAVLAIWFAALIILPTVAFWLTYIIMSH